MGAMSGNLYSFVTFSNTSFARVASDRAPKSRDKTLRELGQVEFLCGKSFDHMQLSVPQFPNMNFDGGSLKNVA